EPSHVPHRLRTVVDRASWSSSARAISRRKRATCWVRRYLPAHLILEPPLWLSPAGFERYDWRRGMDGRTAKKAGRDESDTLDLRELTPGERRLVMFRRPSQRGSRPARGAARRNSRIF